MPVPGRKNDPRNMTKVTQLSLDEEGGLDRRRIHLREISGDSEAPLETVGQDLRAARLRRGDDLATVSRALKIRKDHLEAVEQDDIEALPGRTYAIGFVRTYASYLGLDTTATVERFKQEISGRPDEHAAPAPMMHDDDPRRLPYGWRIVAGAVCLALIYGAWHLFSAGPAPQPVPAPPALAPPHGVAAAKPEQAANQAGNQTGDQAAPQTSATDQAANPPTPPLEKDATAGQALPDQADSPNAPAVPGAGHVYGQQNQNPRVVLRARNDVRITIRDESGRIYLNQDLKPGDTFQAPNRVGLFMATSNAGAVEVDLDGVAMGRAGAQQEILGRVSLDPQSLVDRFDH
jgi:cytoskeleton protein RodZ